MNALPRSLVLVENRRSRRAAAGLQRAHDAIARQGLRVLERVSVEELERLRPWLASDALARPIIVAAGGDGTVGAVANYVARTGAALGILPLGTANNVARSLGIPSGVEGAVRLLADGEVATIDVGRFVEPGAAPRSFVQAAMVGLGVNFARLATRRSFRRRLGRLTYVLALMRALRASQPFLAELRFGDRSIRVRALHLMVLNAPVLGWVATLRAPGSDVDDRRLDVLALEALAWPRLLPALLALVLGQPLSRSGVRVFHTRTVYVHVERPLGVSLDGEVSARLPGEFAIEHRALRVIASRAFFEHVHHEG